MRLRTTERKLKNNATTSDSDDLPEDAAVCFIRLFALPVTNTVPETICIVSPTQDHDRNEEAVPENLTPFPTADMLLMLQQPNPVPAEQQQHPVDVGSDVTANPVAAATDISDLLMQVAVPPLTDARTIFMITTLLSSFNI